MGLTQVTDLAMPLVHFLSISILIQVVCKNL
jgi:hypothetical protein